MAVGELSDPQLEMFSHSPSTVARRSCSTDRQSLRDGSECLVAQCERVVKLYMHGAIALQRNAKCVGGGDVDRQPGIVWPRDQMGRRDHLGETMEDYELRHVLGQLPLLKGRRQIGQGMGPLLRPRKTIHALRIATDRAHSLGLGIQHGIEAAL